MRPTLVRSRWPWSMRLNLARLVFSQSCSLFLSVVSLRLRIISLIVSLSAAISPWASTAIDRVRSPLVTAVATSAMARTWRGQVGGELVDVLGQRLPGAGGAGHLGLAAELPFDADLAGHRRHLVGEGGQRVDHAVDRVGQFGDFALGLDRQLSLQVAVGHRRSRPWRCRAPGWSGCRPSSSRSR